MEYTLHDFEVLASGLHDEQDDIEALIKSCSAPDVIYERLQEMHQLLEALVIHVYKDCARVACHW